MDPKPLYESPEAKACWDVPAFAEREHLNRVEIQQLQGGEGRYRRNELSKDEQSNAEG